MPNSRRNIPEHCWSCEETWEQTDSEPNRYDGEYYCDSCYDRQREEDSNDSDYDNQNNYSGIFSYSFKPDRPVFHLDNVVSSTHVDLQEPAFGIELETEYIGNQDRKSVV